MFPPGAARRYSLLAISCLAVLVLVWPGRLARIRKALAPARQATPELQEWTLRSTGGFSALDGDFFTEGGRLEVYSHGEEPDRLNPKTGMPEYSSTDEWPPAPKRKPFYHEGYDFLNGEWVRKVKEFSVEPDKYLDFGSCDRADHLDLPIEKEMREELSSPIKIKAIHKFGGYVTVVYSEPSQEPLDVFRHYPSIEVDLLVPDQGGWRVADSQEADEYGYFCGTTTFSTTLANGEPATVLLVYTVDPGNHNDDHAARGFIVRRKLPQQQK